MTPEQRGQIRCRDCGAEQGHLHNFEYCSQERCPQCGGQRISCGCGYDDTLMQLPRLPFIMWPSLCHLCGELFPTLFDVPDKVWKHYVQPGERHHVICLGCWAWLTDTIDHSAYVRKYGDAVPLWSPEFRRRHNIPDDEPSPFDGSTVATRG